MYVESNGSNYVAGWITIVMRMTVMVFVAIMMYDDGGSNDAIDDENYMIVVKGMMVYLMILRNGTR